MAKTAGTFLLIAALLFTLVPEASAQSTQWERLYSGGNRYGRAVEQTSDGGYILCGYAYLSSATRQDVLLVKTDAAGTMMWERILGTSDLEYGMCIAPTSDGGYIIGGNYYSSSVGNYDVLLMKVDSSGNFMWQRNLGSPTVNDTCYSIEQTADGGYILCGQSGSGATDSLIIKADAAGNQQWLRTFGGRDYDHGRAVRQTPDGGYLLAGMIYYSYSTRYQAWLIKLDAAGNKQWERMYGGSGYDYLVSIEPTADGGYILGGYVFLSYTNGYDFLLIKVDANGIQQWSRSLGGPGHQYCYDLDVAADGGYIMSGYGYYPGTYHDGLLIKADANGNEEWQQTYGGTGYEYLYGVQQAASGGYIAAGYARPTRSYAAAWLLKVGSSANQPPVADAGADQSLFADASCTAAALLDGNGSSDPDSTPGTNDDIASFDWYEGSTMLGSAELLSSAFGPGTHTVTLQVTDQAGESDSDDAIVSVVDVSPPNITVPSDQLAECSGPAGQPVSTGSAAASDNCCDAAVSNNAPALYSLGTTEVTWVASDCYGNSSSAIQNVTIQDTIPPDLDVSLTPEVLWPPNHKMVEIVVTTTASDICCGSDVSVSLVSVRTSEGDVENTFDPLFDADPSTGYIGDDIQIINGQVFLRAERNGNAGGRVYTLTYQATDCAGNVTTVDVTVTAPRDMS